MEMPTMNCEDNVELASSRLILTDLSLLRIN